MADQSANDLDPAEAIRIRIKGRGVEGWAYRVEDAETGRYIPATKVELSIDPKGDVTATLTVLVSEVDIETTVWRSKTEG